MSEMIPMLPDYKVQHFAQILAETKDYNHEMLNIPEIWRRTKGKDVTIVVLDSGVPNHIDINMPTGHSVINGYLEDENGHATHVGGIIHAIANNNMGVAGLCPDAVVAYCAVLNKQGSGSIDGIIQGIQWAVEMEADIINMSLGISHGAPHFQEFEDKCNWAASKGVTIIAAAGNEAGKVGQPASYSSVIAVASVNNKEEHSLFSNVGPEVDVAAGGGKVYSTYLKNGYARLSGTSMASPVISSVMGLIISDHRKRGKELSTLERLEHLIRICVDVGPDGYDTTFGHGIPFFKKSAVENPDEDRKQSTDPIDYLKKVLFDRKAF